MVEYAGEVVRHSVSDVRERRLYNALVGAGTYTFTLNGGQGLGRGEGARRGPLCASGNVKLVSKRCVACG